MRILRPEAALAAALLASGCAGDAAARRDVELLQAELAAVRQENRELARTVELLSGRVDALSARLSRPADPPRAEAAPPEPAPLVPGGLAVVKMEPPAARRGAPLVPTSTAIVEPEAARLEALARRSGRELAADAEAELRAARRAAGLARAHALEDFVARYPRHPQADAALVEAGAAYAEASRPDAACSVIRRAVEEYPVGSATSEALWRLAGCEARGGSADGERRALARLVKDFPSTPAARRAGERLAAISGRTGVESPADGPARSGP